MARNENDSSTYHHIFKDLIKSGRKPPGEPLQIVYYRETSIGGACKISLNNENLVKVLSTVGDRKVVILSVCGAYRTGKSFLLNYLLRYLKAKQTETRVDHTYYGHLAGFDWAGGSTRTTTGLILWSEPFMLTLNDGSQVAVLLLDTHGLFDDQTPPQVATLLVSVSVLISSVQVYNVKDLIGENHLQTLELIATTASLALEASNTGSPFQRLVFLVRDWCDAARHDYGEEGGAEYLREKFRATPAELQAVRENIERAFENVECFLMPSPGENAMKTVGQQTLRRKKNPFTGKFESLSEDFRDCLPELVEFLFSTSKLSSAVKHFGGTFATSKQIVQHIQSVVSLFQSGQLPPPTSTAQALLDEFNQGIMKRTIEGFLEKMDQTIKATCPNNAASLDQILKPVVEYSVCCFDKQSRGSRHQVDFVRTSLITKLDEMKAVVRKEYEAMWQGLEGKKTLDAFKNSKLNYQHIMAQDVGDYRPYRDPKVFTNIHNRAKERVLESFDQDVSQYKPERGYLNQLRSELQCYCEEKRELFKIKNELNNKMETPPYSQVQKLHIEADDSKGTLDTVLKIVFTVLVPLVKWIWTRFM